MPSTNSGAYPQSRIESMFPMYSRSCMPALIRATARVILRVTNVSPRRGDSWLKRIPLHREHVVRLAVVHGRPVRVELRDAVRRAGMERRRLALRRRRGAEELRRRRLVDARVELRRAHGLEQPERPEPRHVTGVLRRLEADLHVALRAEVVDLGGLHLAQEVDERRRVAEVAVVEEEAPALDVRILVDVVEALGVEARRAPHDPVHLVPLAEQELREIRAVLAGDAGDEGGLRHAPARARDTASAG